MLHIGLIVLRVYLGLDHTESISRPKSSPCEIGIMCKSVIIIMCPSEQISKGQLLYADSRLNRPDSNII